MKKIKALFCVLGISVFSLLNAQNAPDKGLANSISLTLGEGFNRQLNPDNDSAGVGNSTSYSFQLFVPLTKAGKSGWIQSSLGLNVGGTYFKSNNTYNDLNISGFNIAGQTAPAVINIQGLGDNRNDGYKIELGPQLNISAGKLMFSPALMLGYMQLTQQALSINQTSYMGGQPVVYQLKEQQATKSGGLSFTPKVRLSYCPGQVGLWVEGSYSTGPDIVNTSTVLVPLGAPSADGIYKPDQLRSATQKTISSSTAYSNYGVSGGVSFYLNGDKKKKRPPYNPGGGRDDNCDGSVINTGNGGNISVVLNEKGCVIAFPDGTGYAVETKAEKITALNEAETARNIALAQGAQLLGGALPGGAVVSARIVKLTDNNRTKEVWNGDDDDCDAPLKLSDGEYYIEYKVVEKATSGLKDTIKTQVRIGFTQQGGKLKTKHDTAKNSVSNIR